MGKRDRGLWRPPVRVEVEEEFAFHVEMREREYVASGMDPAEAHRLAVSRFGSMADVKATCRTLGSQRERSMKRSAMWTEFRRDMRHGVQQLVRSPGITLVVLITLGLGIGANTALFSVVKSVLLAPLPYAQPDEIVVLWSRWKDFPEKTWVGEEEFLNYRATVRSFAASALVSDFETSITEGDEPERVPAMTVTPELFEMLGVEPAAGRLFTAADAVEGQDSGVLLTWELWQRRYGGDRNIVGGSIQLNGRAQTVLGVLPPDFRLPIDYRDSAPAQLYVAFATRPFTGVPNEGGSHGYYMIARLAPGATVASANAELAQVTARLTREGVYPADWNFSAFVLPAADEVAGEVRPALLVLLGAVAFVLLIACANVANLLFVRAEQRRRELSVRAALGASRGRLMRQLLTENLLLGLGGGAAGLLLAYAGVPALIALAPSSLPRLTDTSIDGGVLLFTAVLAVFTALLFGLLPALQSSRADLHTSLRESGRANSGSVHRARLRQTMIVVQVALAVVLVAGAGLMVRSFARITSVNPGFETERVLTARISTPAAFYESATDVTAFYQRALDEVRALPGIEHAGAIRVLPIDMEMGDTRIHIPGYVDPVSGSQFAPAEFQAATDGFFEAFGMRLVEGRFFSAADRLDAEQVIIVNEAFVDTYFGGRSPLDERLRFGFADDVPWQRIVGVVGNTRHNGITGDVKPTFYRPHQQVPASGIYAQRNMVLVMKTAGDPRVMVADVRSAIARVDPRLPVSSVQSMDDVMHTALAQPRFIMVLLVAFSGLALTLALVGIYGIVSWAVAQRRQEMGIRAALGARPRALVWMTLRTALVQTVAGIALGIVAAAVMTRVLQGMLYQTPTSDPLTYVAVILLATLATLAASWIPARRAAQADPLGAMRPE